MLGSICRQLNFIRFCRMLVFTLCLGVSYNLVWVLLLSFHLMLDIELKILLLNAPLMNIWLFSQGIVKS